MPTLDAITITALATLVSSFSSLVWAFRRKR